MQTTDQDEKFKTDCAKFSGHYDDFVVIAKGREGFFLWHCTDPTWAVGAAIRFLDSVRNNSDKCS